MKKYASYIVILFILIGFFSPMVKVSAQMVEELGQCTVIVAGGYVAYRGETTKAGCDAKAVELNGRATWVGTTDTRDEFQRNIDSGCDGLFNSSVTGCLLKIIYYTIFLS